MLDDIKLLLKVSFPTITIIFLTFLNLFVSKNYFDFGQLFVFQAIFFWLLYTPSLLPIYIIFTLIRNVGNFFFQKYNKIFELFQLYSVKYEKD